jgi:hypothetical protein
MEWRRKSKQRSPRARGGRFVIENGNPLLLAYAKRIGSRYQARGVQ